MHWIVQENLRREAGYDDFLNALKELQVEHTVVKVVPFQWEIQPEPGPELTGPVSAWGSTCMTDVANKYRWVPGVWLNENFDQRIWSEKYGEYGLNNDVQFSRIFDVKEFKDGPRFVRPVHDRKVFAGAVMGWEEFSKLQTAACIQSYRYDVSKRRISGDMPIAISPVRELLAEARYFIVDGVVRAGSLYRHNSQLSQQTLKPDLYSTLYDQWEFTQQIAGMWNPAPAYVMDIARLTEADNFEDRVIEINCINSCGFYAADMRPVIQAVEAL